MKQNLRIVIVGDDFEKRDKIKASMPDYVKCMMCRYGESAIKSIVPDADGNFPDVVAIIGEDSEKKGVMFFDWMRNKSGNSFIISMPVIAIVEDKYSDEALDFLEIGDATIYEGELEENRLFSTVMTVIEEFEFRPEPIEPSYIADKEIDKVAGKTYKPAGDAKKKRSIVLDMDTRLQNLAKALERGKQTTALNKIRIQKGLEPVEKVSVEAIKEVQTELNASGTSDNAQYDFVKNYRNQVVDEDDIPDEFKLNKPGMASAGSPPIDNRISNLTAGMRINPMVASVSHYNHNPVQQYSVPQSEKRRTIVVVDDEEADRRMCEICLSAKYNVVALDSGMKAIDYFVKNKADLILLDTYMPNLGGVQTLASVRWQLNGRNVPVIFMLDKRHPVIRESLNDSALVGIFQKPLSAGGLSVVVDGYFRNKK